jgi:hypothetical protein
LPSKYQLPNFYKYRIVQKNFLPLIAGAFLLSSVFYISCNKLDTTDIGGGLIPPVDNVTTFETTLPVTTTQALFKDSTKIASTDDELVGSINNDNIFGKTNAGIFLQLKPTYYKYFWGNAGDTLSGPGLGLDSVVLCLRFKGFYGDTSKTQQLSVYEISNSVTTFKDSSYVIGSYYPQLNTTALGTATIDARTVGKGFKLKNNRDSVYNQIRIKITNTAFINTLFGRDSTSTNTLNNAFASDSLFNTFYKGFAIFSDSNTVTNNGLFYCNLADTFTRLEVHFKRKAAGNGGKIDTLFAPFTFNNSSSSVSAFSAFNNYIVRKRAGAEMLTPPADKVYVQTTPGSYVDIKIPGLGTLNNCIIHRAELIAEQLPDLPLSTVMVPPSYLYLDVKDTNSSPEKWHPIPYDLSPGESYSFYPSTGGIDYNYFGGFIRFKTDAAGGFGFYNFNLSRYVQHIVTNHNSNLALRLYSPFQINYPEFLFGSIGFPNSLAFGRVRLGSGTHATRPMRLHIIYSKI